MKTIASVSIGVLIGAGLVLAFVTNAPQLCRNVVLKDTKQQALYINQVGSYFKPEQKDFLTELSQ